jgi:hypothetical protein
MAVIQGEISVGAIARSGTYVRNDAAGHQKTGLPGELQAKSQVDVFDVAEKVFIEQPHTLDGPDPVHRCCRTG